MLVPPPRDPDRPPHPLTTTAINVNATQRSSHPPQPNHHDETHAPPPPRHILGHSIRIHLPPRIITDSLCTLPRRPNTLLLVGRRNRLSSPSQHPTRHSKTVTTPLRYQQQLQWIGNFGFASVQLGPQWEQSQFSQPELESLPKEVAEFRRRQCVCSNECEERRGGL